MLFVGTNTLSTEVPAPLAEAPIQLSFSQGPRAESLAPTARDRGFLHCKVSTICLCLHPKFRTLCHYTVGLIANLSITGNLRNSGQVINMRGHFSVPGYWNWLTVFGSVAPLSPLWIGEIKYYKCPIRIWIRRKVILRLVLFLECWCLYILGEGSACKASSVRSYVSYWPDWGWKKFTCGPSTGRNHRLFHYLTGVYIGQV